MRPAPRLARALSGLLVLSLAGCDLVEPSSPPGQEHEVTSVHLFFTELLPDGSESQAVFTGSFRDPDGLGGASPTTRALVLRSPRDFVGGLTLMDDRHDEPIDLTPLLVEDADRIQVFYSVQLDTEGPTVFEIQTGDQDGAGLPLGLVFTATTETVRLAAGRVRVRVSRYARGDKDGTTPSTLSVADVEIPFVILAPPYPSAQPIGIQTASLLDTIKSEANAPMSEPGVHSMYRISSRR